MNPKSSFHSQSYCRQHPHPQESPHPPLNPLPPQQQSRIRIQIQLPHPLFPPLTPHPQLLFPQLLPLSTAGVAATKPVLLPHPQPLAVKSPMFVCLQIGFMVYTMPYSMSVFPVVLPFFKMFLFFSFRQGCVDLSARRGPGAFPYLWETVIHRKGNPDYILIEKGR